MAAGFLALGAVVAAGVAAFVGVWANVVYLEVGLGFPWLGLEEVPASFAGVGFGVHERGSGLSQLGEGFGLRWWGVFLRGCH